MRYSKAHEIFIYKPMRFLTKIYFGLKFGGYKHDWMKLPEGGNLIVSNHTVDMDPFLCLFCFQQPLVFVMSEHIMRKPTVNKLITFLVDTIIRVKTRTESQTAFVMIKKLKAGKNIMIFPEGSMTYTGVSKDIIGGLGRLAKISGANLVTMRLENTFGYGPRWAESSGRGKAYGRIVHVYTKEELKEKKADEIEEIIRNDTYFDLYAEKRPPIRNKKRAEFLDNFLYICPECGKISTVHGKGTKFSCSCGLDLELDGNMYFHAGGGKHTPFANIHEWYLWEREETLKRVENWKQQTGPITKDTGITFNSYTIAPPKTNLLIEGDVVLYPDRLVILNDHEERQIPLSEITDVTTVQRKIFSFVVNKEEYYEIVGGETFSTVKYAYIMSALSEMKVNV